jgi:hypothetical protein
VEEDEILEPTRVIPLEELPEELRAEKERRDIDRALREWRARRDFVARYASPASIFRGITL